MSLINPPPNQVPGPLRKISGGFLESLAQSVYLIFERVRDFDMNGARVTSGKGSPEGSEVGSIGDLYTDKEGGAVTTLYVKESGSNTDTGWIAK